MQFAHLTQMQLEIDATSPPVPISIIGVNYIGAEAGSPSVTAVSDLPWLQDVVSEDAWVSWGAVNKTVHILGTANEQLATFNVALNDLSIPANYDALKQLLLDTAAAQ